MSQIDKLRNNHQCQLTEKQNEHDNKCRDLENEFETRLSEQIADGLRPRFTPLCFTCSTKLEL